MTGAFTKENPIITFLTKAGWSYSYKQSLVLSKKQGWKRSPIYYLEIVIRVRQKNLPGTIPCIPRVVLVIF